MATFGDINLNESTTVTARLAAALVTRNSTVQAQEIMCLGDPDSTNSSAVAKVTNAALDSTGFGLGVRARTHPESTNWASSAGFHFNSSGALTVDITGGNSTLVSVTPTAGSTFRTQPGSTAWASSAGFHFDSSGALQVNLSQPALVEVHIAGNSSASNYQPVRLVDSSGTGFLTPGNEYTAGSTYSSHAGPTLAYDNSSNNTYRTVGLSTPLPTQARRPGRLSVYSTVVSTASTAFYTLVSSAATAAVVRAYSITSTASAAMAVTFHDSTNNTPVWGLQVGSQSSGVTGANLAMQDGIFQITAGGLLALRLGTTGVEVHVALSYHQE